MQNISRCHRQWNQSTTKSTKWYVRTAKTQISLVIRPVWSESLLSAWRRFESLATHKAHGRDSDHASRIRRLMWVFAGRKGNLVVMSCSSSLISEVSTKSTYYSNIVFPYWSDKAMTSVKVELESRVSWESFFSTLQTELTPTRMRYQITEQHFTHAQNNTVGLWIVKILATSQSLFGLCFSFSWLQFKNNYPGLH